MAAASTLRRYGMRGQSALLSAAKGPNSLRGASVAQKRSLSAQGKDGTYMSVSRSCNNGN
jgi:hypothetical protein